MVVPPVRQPAVRPPGKRPEDRMTIAAVEQPTVAYGSCKPRIQARGSRGVGRAQSIAVDCDQLFVDVAARHQIVNTRADSCFDLMSIGADATPRIRRLAGEIDQKKRQPSADSASRDREEVCVLRLSLSIHADHCRPLPATRCAGNKVAGDRFVRMRDLDELGRRIESSQVLQRAILHGVEDAPSTLIAIREKQFGRSIVGSRSQKHALRKPDMPLAQHPHGSCSIVVREPFPLAVPALAVARPDLISGRVTLADGTGPGFSELKDAHELKAV